MSYVRTLTICLLLVYFVSAAGCHCFDLHKQSADNDTDNAVPETPKSHLHTESWDKKEAKYRNNKRKTSS